MLPRPRFSAEKWGVGLVTKLLEVTHGQWLYRNIQVHDKISGTLVTLQKEELQLEIERQQELGMAGLLDKDCHLAECNLGDLEDSSGAKETYWLLAIRAAREGSRLLASTTDGTRGEQGGTEVEEGNYRRALISTAVYRTTVIWLSSHMYPGESPGRRVALSSGSNCDAVWLWPSAYEDSFNG
jgi:hypothetical protein